MVLGLPRTIVHATHTLLYHRRVAISNHDKCSLEISPKIIYTNRRSIGSRNRVPSNTFKVPPEITRIIISVVPKGLELSGGFPPIDLSDTINKLMITKIRRNHSRITDILRIVHGKKVNERLRVSWNSSQTVDKLLKIQTFEGHFELFTQHNIQSGKVGNDDEVNGGVRMPSGPNVNVVNSAYPLKTDIDDCASHPCENNGTCTDRVNGFNCSCAQGFNGTQCGTGNQFQSSCCFIMYVISS